MMFFFSLQSSSSPGENRRRRPRDEDPSDDLENDVSVENPPESEESGEDLYGDNMMRYV